ncbi:16S rRNA (guanine(527)-N(7))-methyltransferase RsmG [Nocardioides sp. AX2bis]|uniref:16S rRNA (guanine(527)-N(7))-methyltransferase RsmG n=1 Tax=Nocardioides sp. AX2bis TaxID=2653157 RepID=UPI001F4160A1|nr:16S rRNA (guanine(527)-N(7))-methyltransferase RsmG [Nocardioides sp. AX2bis]
MFSSAALPVVERYAALLATEGVVRGLIGPREVPRLWDRHLVNSMALAPALADGARVCDVGTGAGLPGLVLAIGRPDLTVTLVEPLLRRTTFLSEVVEDLGLENVTVLRARAEEVRGSSTFDVVTSRAVAPLGRLLEWCMPLTSAHGHVLALKGSRAAEEIRTVRPLLGRNGWAPPELVQVGPDGVLLLDGTTTPNEDPSTVRAVRVRWADPARVSSSVGRAGSSGPGTTPGPGRRGRGSGRPRPGR